MRAVTVPFSFFLNCTDRNCMKLVFPFTQGWTFVSRSADWVVSWSGFNFHFPRKCRFALHNNSWNFTLKCIITTSFNSRVVVVFLISDYFLCQPVPRLREGKAENIIVLNFKSQNPPVRRATGHAGWGRAMKVVVKNVISPGSEKKAWSAPLLRNRLYDRDRCWDDIKLSGNYFCNGGWDETGVKNVKKKCMIK